MGLFRSIPLIERELPFLQEVNFTELQKELVRVRNLNAQRSQGVIPEDVSETDGLCTKFPRIVGIQHLLESLCLNLEPATSSGVCITGPRECGKTTLVEALIRARAQGRLSSQLGTKPFYVFDATGYFLQSKPGDRIQPFIRALNVVAASNGLLIIDHIDDFVEMAGSDATLLLNALVSMLEQFRRRGMAAIIVAEDSGMKEVTECGKSLPRVFKSFPITHEPGLDELKPILTAAAVMLEKVHNVRYTEEAIDEVIRILSRYPGRAFTAARPGNAIQFLDMTGAYVSRMRFAEPPHITEMRSRLSLLQDEYVLVSESGDAGRIEQLSEVIAALTQKYVTVEGEWRQKFEPLEKARKNFATIERELPILRAIVPLTEKEKGRMEQLQVNDQRTRDEDAELALLKAKRPRSKEEEIKFNIYTDNYEKSRDAVAQAEAALYTSIPRVQADHPRAVFNCQTGFSIKSPLETRERLKNLDAYLSSQIFRQDKPRIALANAYRARERGVKDPARPIVLLFGGGSGLGKTELVKALVRYHVGMETRPDLADQLTPVTISLSEFGDKSSVSKLIGAAPGLVGYDEPIPWHEEIRKDPRAIVLFDEGDKAHPVVMLTLMQAFDEGVLKDSAQRPVNFKDTIIVININGITAASLDPARKDDPDHIFESVLRVQSEAGGNLFTAAVLNRIDGLYIFDDLLNEDLVKILGKEIRKLNNDFRDQCVSVVLDDATAESLIATFPNQSAGGRWPRKLVQTMLRPQVLQYIDRRDSDLCADGAPQKCVLQIVLKDKAIVLVKE